MNRILTRGLGGGTFLLVRGFGGVGETVRKVLRLFSAIAKELFLRSK